MPIIPLRDEKNIGELVAKVFPDLAPKEKKKAEAALLRANPQLNSFAKVPRGTLLVAPKLSGIGAKTKGEAEEPVANIIKMLTQALDPYREQLKQASEQGINEARNTRKYLADSKFKKTIERQTELQEMVKKIEKAVGEREEEFTDLQTFATKDLEAAENDLAKILAQLS